MYLLNNCSSNAFSLENASQITNPKMYLWVRDLLMAFEKNNFQHV